MTSDLHRYLARQPGRCPACTWHTATQGHRPDCPKQAATNGLKPALTWDNGRDNKKAGPQAATNDSRTLATPETPGELDD